MYSRARARDMARLVYVRARGVLGLRLGARLVPSSLGY